MPAGLDERAHVLGPAPLSKSTARNQQVSSLEQGIHAHHVLSPQVREDWRLIDGHERLVRTLPALDLRKLAHAPDELVRARGRVAWLARLLAYEARGKDILPTAEELPEQLDLLLRRRRCGQRAARGETYPDLLPGPIDGSQLGLQGGESATSMPSSAASRASRASTAAISSISCSRRDTGALPRHLGRWPRHHRASDAGIIGPRPRNANSTIAGATQRRGRHAGPEGPPGWTCAGSYFSDTLRSTPFPRNGMRTPKTRNLLSLKELAGWTGLEPATSDVTGRRSNQLNYHPARVAPGLGDPSPGGRYRIRTCDTRRVRPVLYR